jgi:hypothetical protein
MGPKLQAPDELASRGRVFAFPATFMGRWSLKLLVGWVVLLVLTFVAVVLHGGSEATRRLSMAAGGKFYSLPSVAVPMAAGFLSAIAAFFVAFFAIIRRGERSIAMLLPIVLGGLMLLFVIGEFLE